MTKTPTVVVEGIDDVPVYDNLAEQLEGTFQILAVENIDGYSAGCDGVTSAMDYINGLSPSKFNYKKFIVGIIDKDIKDYRGEISSNGYIFPLKYYSMESHFVCREITNELIKFSTKTTSGMRGEVLESYVYNKVISSLNLLYLISLEALKGGIDRNYTAEVSFSSNVGRFKDPTLISRIREKEELLLSFAHSLELSFSIESMRKFVKGKWLLEVFCIEIEKVIKTLSLECSNNEFDTCQFCISEAYDKCLYKIKDGINHKVIKCHAMNFTNNSNFEYIKSKLNEMVSDAA